MFGFGFGSAKTKDDGDGAGTSDGKDATTNSLSDVPRKSIRFQQETEASVSDIVIRPARDSGDSNTSDEGTSAQQRSRRSTLFEQSRQSLLNRLRNGRTYWFRCTNSLSSLMKKLVRYVGRLFTVPWSRERICFKKQDDAGKSNGATSNPFCSFC
jgi:hypothetical protein